MCTWEEFVVCCWVECCMYISANSSSFIVLLSLFFPCLSFVQLYPSLNMGCLKLPIITVELSCFFLWFFFFVVVFINLLIYVYFWLCWVFVSMRGLSPVAASGGHSSSRCTGLSPSWPLLLRSAGSRCAGSVVVAHGLSGSAACGILPDQGLNPCPPHWQADSQPLRHQGSPSWCFKKIYFLKLLIN